MWLERDSAGSQVHAPQPQRPQAQRGIAAETADGLEGISDRGRRCRLHRIVIGNYLDSG